jgi:hypothetical protein
MTMVQVLDGANTTAQWYYDNYPSGSIFSRLDKFVLHTTETESWPGYSGGASAPNATYFPLRREIRQHFPNNVSARALADPSSTPVRENRDNVFQLEMICYSDYKLAQSVNGLWVGDLTDAHFNDLAKMMHQLHRELGLPLGDSVTWKEGQKTYVSGVRLSSSGFDAYRGILGHVHVSGNSHWDPGGFRMSRLRPKLTTISPPEDHLSAADVAELKTYIDRRFIAERDDIQARMLAALNQVQEWVSPGVKARAEANGSGDVALRRLIEYIFNDVVFWPEGSHPDMQKKIEEIDAKLDELAARLPA